MSAHNCRRSQCNQKVLILQLNGTPFCPRRGATYIRPPSPHCFIICMKPAARRYPLCLMCSSPYNLCRSHTLPFRPTSNPYSPFHSADTPVSLTIRASSLRTRTTSATRPPSLVGARYSCRCPPSPTPAHLMTVVLPIPRSVCKIGQPTV